jgi:hypothetical protein
MTFVQSDTSEFVKSSDMKDSSVSIASGYGLDDWAIEVQSPAEVKGFFL